MRRPSTPFMILGGIMIILFVVGLILIAVLISRNSTPSDLELTATAVTGSNQTLLFELPLTQTQAAVEVQTLAASPPTVESPSVSPARKWADRTEKLTHTYIQIEPLVTIKFLSQHAATIMWFQLSLQQASSAP